MSEEYSKPEYTSSTFIGITLINNRQIASWPLTDVRELRQRLCEAIENVSVLKAMGSGLDKEQT